MINSVRSHYSFLGGRRRERRICAKNAFLVSGREHLRRAGARLGRRGGPDRLAGLCVRPRPLLSPAPHLFTARGVKRRCSHCLDEPLLSPAPHLLRREGGERGAPQLLEARLLRRRELAPPRRRRLLDQPLRLVPPLPRRVVPARRREELLRQAEPRLELLPLVAVKQVAVGACTRQAPETVGGGKVRAREGGRRLRSAPVPKAPCRLLSRSDRWSSRISRCTLSCTSFTSAEPGCSSRARLA